MRTRFELVNVTHPSTNRARCRITTLTKTNSLPLHQTATAVYPSIMHITPANRPSPYRAQAVASWLSACRVACAARSSRSNNHFVQQLGPWTFLHLKPPLTCPGANLKIRRWLSQQFPSYKETSIHAGWPKINCTFPLA